MTRIKLETPSHQQPTLPFIVLPTALDQQSARDQCLAATVGSTVRVIRFPGPWRSISGGLLTRVIVAVLTPLLRGRPVHGIPFFFSSSSYSAHIFECI